MAPPKKAANAYELLQRVCAAIKAHPLAYYQAAWVLTNKWEVQSNCEFTDAQMAESCGTAYCRAGWIVALHDGRRAALQLEKDGGWLTSSVCIRANRVLGLEPEQTYRLFDGGAIGGRPGTRRYVAAGIRGVRAFMNQHAAHLKARSLKGV